MSARLGRKEDRKVVGIGDKRVVDKIFDTFWDHVVSSFSKLFSNRDMDF